MDKTQHSAKATKTVDSIERILSEEIIEIQFKNEEAANLWKNWVTNPEGKYTRDTVAFACRWAKCMQYFIETYSRKVSEVAESAYHMSKNGVVTLGMYETACTMLEKCWKYGEELHYDSSMV